ncbi:anti-sigma factor [Neobacillus pocheonensis]|uniref:anti-sigma factor domain-containing protein n=1 Tax=Neobacillus pocheonensis TaxID=363869 RepID=UPI003D273834
MTINHICSFSSDLVSYLLGEASEEEMNLFEEHLLTCSDCRIEVQEMREAWNLIPFKLDDVEVPSDLKAEVMNAIFKDEDSPIIDKEENSTKTITKPKSAGGIRRTFYGIAAAAFLLSFGGIIWNNFQLREELAEVKEQTLPLPVVVQGYMLKSADPLVATAQGNALLYKQGDKKQMVFKFQGLASTKGSEAYQVWLIHDGKRMSAGTFQVDQNGNGSLSYVINDNHLAFEAIGVSLEPDANGTQPRGKKVLGTT